MDKISQTVLKNHRNIDLVTCRIWQPNWGDF